MDTELGVAASLVSADVGVEGTAEGDVMSVTVAVDVRVGEHASGEREVALIRADVLMDGSQVGQVPLDRPAGFDPTLAPGESRSVMTAGRSAPGAFPTARDQLCGAPANVTVLVHVRDAISDESTIVEGRASGVECN